MDPKEINRHLKDILKEVTEEFELKSKVRCQEEYNSKAAPAYEKHFILHNKYLISYINLFPDAATELLMQEVGPVLHPDLYKGGILIISKHELKSAIDDTALLERSRLLSCENEDIIDNNILMLPMYMTEYRCSGSSISAKQPLLGKTRPFHTNESNKALAVCTKKLAGLPMKDARLFSSIWVKMKDTNLPLLLVKCDKGAPLKCTWQATYFEKGADNKPHFRVCMLKELSTLDSKYQQQTGQECYYFARYNIFGGGDSGSNLDESCQETTSLHGEFLWSSVAECSPNEPPPHSAWSVIKVKVTAGEERSPIYPLFTDITTLDEFLLRDDYSTILFNANSNGIYEQLHDFKKAIGDFSYYGHVDKEEDTKENQPTVSMIMSDSFSRKDEDFTDKLWLLVCQARDFTDLKNAIEDIVSDIAHSSLQPAIGPNNATKLGTFIRKLYVADNEEEKVYFRDKLLEFLSTDKSIMQLVWDIGYQKLKKDYFHFFLGRELTTLEKLETLSKKKVQDNTMLWKMHYCAEVIVTASVYLNLPYEYQRSLLQSAIQYYASHEVEPCSPVFTFSFSTLQNQSELHEQCQTRLPTVWSKAWNVGKKYKETMILDVLNISIKDEDDSNSQTIQTVRLLSEKCHTMIS